MLTGRGRYVSDWSLPGQAYGHFLRSDRAHAKIVSIQKDEALKSPGVIAVFTGQELVDAGLKPIPAAAPFKWKDGSAQRLAQRPSLAHEVVRHVGEPVALIVAETAAQAQDAAEAVVVEYEDLPAVTTAAQAMAPGAPQLHPGAPGNLVLDFVGGDEAATDAAFAKAAKVVKLTAYHSRVIGNPMEPRAAMGSYDPAKDLYFLHGTTQGTGPMRGQLSAVLGVPPEKVRVVAEEVGGGFGVRFNAYPEYGALLYAAKKLGRPVKWVGTRSEVFLGDEQARDIRHTGELALDADGRILGMRFDYLSNMGAYVAFTGAVVNTLGPGERELRRLRRAGGPRARPAGAHQHHSHRRLPRRRPAGGVVCARAPGRRGGARARPRPGGVPPPQHDPAGEDALQAGRRLRVRLRRLRGGDEQGARRSPTGRVSSKRRAKSKKQGKLRGRGIATYIEMTAPGGFAPYDQAHVTWEEDGSVTLRTASHNHGQGHETTFAQIVSRRARHPGGADPPAHLRAGARPRRQPDRRLAHAARPGQRDALGLAGDREERPRPRRRAPRERGAGHRVRPRGPTGSREPTARCASTSWRRSTRASSTSTSRTAPRCRPPSRTAATSPKWRSTRRPASATSCPTSPATTSATSSTTRSSKGRCRAASPRAPGTSSSSRASTTPPASC